MLDLSVYILKYTSITQLLTKSNEMSTTQRCRHLLDGLSEQLHDKAFDFCMRNDWKLSSHDTGTKDPEFDKLKMFVLGKALSAKKKVMYNKERATEGYDDLKKAVIDVVKTPPTPSSSLAVTPNSDLTIVKLTKQLANLTLMIQAHMNLPKPETTKPNASRTSDRRCV